MAPSGGLFVQSLQSAVVSQGSYKCGGCKPGFLGNQTSGCFPRKSCAALTFNPCDSNAHCTNERNGEVACRVSVRGHSDTSSYFLFNT